MTVIQLQAPARTVFVIALVTPPTSQSRTTDDGAIRQTDDGTYRILD